MIKSIPALLTVYLLLLLILILAWLNPDLKVRSQEIDVMLLLDDSTSISEPYKQQQWKKFLTLAESLIEGSRVSLIRFADHAELEIPWTEIQGDTVKQWQSTPLPRTRALNTGATDLMAGLRSALGYLSGDRHSAIILLSDGVQSINQKDQIQMDLTRPGLTVFYQGPGNDTTARPPAYIESINWQRSPKRARLSVAIKAQKVSNFIVELRSANRLLSSQNADMTTTGVQVILTDPLPISNRDERLTLTLLDQNNQLLDQRRLARPLPRQSQILIVSNSLKRSALAARLSANWKISIFLPQELPQNSDFLSAYDIVILDNIPASELSTAFVSSLRQQVTQHALGLIVNGGEHAFSVGGYRHSALEKILPVISEPAKAHSAAAFAFVLDKSGSMDGQTQNHSRLENALSAVVESARFLLPGDESTLLVFDQETETLLPLEKRLDAVPEFKNTRKLRASGSTDLLKAIRKSAETLSQSDLDNRLLIVVSDGIIKQRESLEINDFLQQQRIQLIALVIGNRQPSKVLQQLVASSKGQLIPVKNSAKLEFSLRQTMEQTRRNWVNRQSTPITLSNFSTAKSNDWHWQPLNGFALTRIRPDARILVSSETGDPLLAQWQAGAGRVFALPGGWLNRDNGASVLPYLLELANSHRSSPQIRIMPEYDSTKLLLNLDIAADHYQWQSQPVTLRRLSPEHTNTLAQAQVLEAIAAGRYHAEFDLMTFIPSQAEKFLLNLGEKQYQFQIVQDIRQEMNFTQPSRWLINSMENSTIKTFSPQDFQQFITSGSENMPTRQIWLFLFLIIYLLLMSYSRFGTFRISPTVINSWGD